MTDSPENKSNDTKSSKISSKKHIPNSEYEIALWYIAAFLPIIYSVNDAYRSVKIISFVHLIVEVVPSIFSAALIIFIPIFAKKIFGQYPLIAFSEAINKPKLKPDLADFRYDIRIEENLSSSPENFSANKTDPRVIMESYAESSRIIAKNIYNRAGVYLMAGAFIAFSGIAIFYLVPTAEFGAQQAAPAVTKDHIDKFIDLLPRFGMLFFVEFVAIFFLRQYRSAMDDFRYYDAIRRQREESLVVLSMFAENKNGIVPTKEVLQSMSIYSQAGSIGKNEISTIIELRKLDRDELVFFEKIIEGLSALKPQKKDK